MRFCNQSRARLSIVTSDKSDQREREALAVLDDVAAEVGQSAIEVILSEDVLQHLPFVKGLVAVSKSVVSIRDKFLMRKIESFLRSLASIPQETRRDMIRRLEEDPVYTETVGEHLVELLDRLEGRRKAAIIGHALAAFARKEIDLTMLRRLENVTDRLPAMEIDTVRLFVNAGNSHPAEGEFDQESVQALMNAGLAESVSTSPGGGRREERPNTTCRKFVELDLDLKSKDARLIDA
jgi:hypothetical protein